MPGSQFTTFTMPYHTIVAKDTVRYLFETDTVPASVFGPGNVLVIETPPEKNRAPPHNY